MTTDFAFKPATKKALKARVAFAGPAGSGKSWTSLVTAEALAGGARFAVIDTERGSASLYSDRFAFDALNLYTFAPRDLVKALASAAQAGYPVVVIDSLSHFWAGAEGMLEQVDHAAKRSFGGNSFGGWKEVRPMERELIDAMLAFPGHVIVTMRTKTEWVIQENERGKKVPTRIGTKPEQRDGLEYEFSLVGDLDLEHTLVVSKSRCSDLADAVIPRPDGAFGKTILAWLADGAEAKTATDYLAAAAAAGSDLDALRALHEEAAGAGQIGAAVMYGGETRRLGDVIQALGAPPSQPVEPECAPLLEQIGAAATAAGVSKLRVAEMFASEHEGRHIKTGTAAELRAVLVDLETPEAAGSPAPEQLPEAPTGGGA